MVYFSFPARFVPLRDQNRKLVVEAMKQGKWLHLPTVGGTGDSTLPRQICYHLMCLTVVIFLSTRSM